MIPFDETISETNLLSLVASAEAKSEHPLGKAIVAYAKAKEVPVMESTAFRMTTGKGIFAEVDNRRLLCGNEKFLIENGVSIDNKIGSALERLRTQGKASILVAKCQKCIGVIALSDVLRPKARDMVSRLSDMQTRTVLLTGDHQKTADYFAQKNTKSISNTRSTLFVKSLSETPAIQPYEHGDSQAP